MDRLQLDLTKYLDATALIHYKHDKSCDEVKYKDLLKQVLKANLLLESEKLSKTESVAIGILCKKHPSAISLMLAVMEADFAFCFLSRDNIPQELNKLGIKYFFSDETLPPNDLLILRNSFECFGQQINLYKTSCPDEVRLFKDNCDPMYRICYTVTTSGTTGQRKIVRVTYKCIESNVIALQRIFKLGKDVIYSSAPCMFDVFVLDVFLALHSGSALMIMDESHRYSEESLDFMFSSKSTGVTFFQVTPSVFQRHGIENIKNKIMNPASSLKMLALGGEQFPSAREVLTWQDWDSSSKKRVFNIYGTTEVSCWAMIHEVTKEDLLSGEVPLGTLLDDTTYAFSPELDNNLGLEEMVLTTKTRICFVDNKSWDEQLDKGNTFAQLTGDFVRRYNNNVYYYGRRNDIIKKFGERVNLSKIEIVALEVVPVAACIYMKKKVALFVKTDDDHLVAALNAKLKERLQPSEVPDDIRKISFFPLTENGKICKQQLKQIYKDLLKKDRDKRVAAEETFLEAINQILNLKLGKPSSSASEASDEPDGKRMKTEMDLTFKALGLTSFDALRISMKLEDQTGLSNGLLPKLLDDRHTIHDICLYLKDMRQKKSDKAVETGVTSSSIVTKVVQRFNLEKCVDSSPALLRTDTGNFVSVGSHSHQLITIDAKSLKLVSKTTLGDRIECEVTQLNQSGLVGSYDGNLYCFDLQSGAIKWKFDSKGMIKSKALVVGETVIFGNYNHDKNLWCLQQTEAGGMDVKWSKLVGSRGGILSVPLLINDTTVLICTLEGTCELLNTADGETIWIKKLENPVFSCPQKVPGRNEVLVAEVSKTVHCIDFDGNFLWKFTTDGHIFSSFLFHQENPDEIKILFGCHDKKLRCLNYNYESKSASCVWSSELQSQIYGTPRLISINSENYIISCATDGNINFVNLSSGAIEHTHKLQGEIFSTPVIVDRMVFVGCRDNFLYCLQF